MIVKLIIDSSFKTTALLFSLISPLYFVFIRTAGPGKDCLNKAMCDSPSIGYIAGKFVFMNTITAIAT